MALSLLLLSLALLIDRCLSGCGAEDSTLNIEKKCGETYSISLTYDSTERELSMYIPTILCDQAKFTEFINKKLANRDYPFNPSLGHQITLPMLISLHCLGCVPMNEISKWQSYAEEFTFILIAPQGIGSSWNADQCCDPAVENNADDIGFIQTIVNGAQTSFPSIFPYATVSNKNYDGFVWLTGFSNGGFMADKIAWISSINQFSKIVAAAPMAGYIYDNSKYIKNALKNGDKHNNVAMYFHHSKTDNMVNPNGCCMDSTNGCCCNIAQKSLKCLSIYDEWKNWLKWNNCNDNIKYKDIAIDSIINDVSHSDKPVQVTCAYATPQQYGCNTFTSLCMHGSDTRHAQWVRGIPQSRDVMLFFLKSLCLQQAGRFNDSMVKCECDAESIFDGLHCISPKTALGMKMDDVNKQKAEVIEPVIDEKKTDKKEKVLDDKKEMVDVEKDEDKNILNGDNNEDIKPEAKWQKTVRNGQERQKRRNKDLSILGSANNKYSDKQFEFNSINKDVNDIPDSWLKIPNTSIVLVCTMLFVSIGLFIMYKRKQSGYRYSKVNMNDDDESNNAVNTVLINQ